METTTEQSTGLPADPTRREEWFLAQIEKPDLPLDSFLHAFSLLRREGESELAESWADVLRDTLVERGRTMDALTVLKEMAVWRAPSPDWTARCRDAAVKALEKDLERRNFPQHVGFDRGVAAAEAVRRLLLLLTLKPGTLCLDKTWGFGVVKHVDVFYGRVEIDFEKKREHRMSMAYAAEALQLLDESHLLAQLHREPAKMKELVASNPAEVVRMALRSYGPLNVAQLQEVLVPRLVEEAGWKTFWDGARRGLKKGGLVDIPTRRTDPLRILERAKAYDDFWVQKLAPERDMETLLKRVEEFIDNRPEQIGAAAMDVLGDRLAFVVKGARGDRADFVVRAAMAAAKLGIPATQVDVAAHAAAFRRPAAFLDVAANLPARMVRPFIDFLASHDGEATAQLLLDLLMQLNLTTLNEAMDFLALRGLEDKCAVVFRDAFAGQTVNIEMLYWITRNMERLEQWSLGTRPFLGQLILSQLNETFNGDRLKTRNQLRDRFGQIEWLVGILDETNDRQRREMILRVRECPAWPQLDRQSIVGHIVKRYPELEEVLAGRPDAASIAPGAARGPLTSHRSYHERQAQLERLIRVDIPQNSKEIAIARSYGDLSENHEFKAAKEAQGILLRRRADLELMLRRMTPSDFKDLPHDKAGLATSVKLRYADGRVETYHILGEWDQDAALGIISSETRMAQALSGHAAGDEVTVPTEAGDVTCRLEEVAALPPEIQTWVEGVLGVGK